MNTEPKQGSLINGPNYVTLTNGESARSDSEEWRRETFARWVLKMPLQKRREWLAEFERLNGITVTNILKADMMAQHKARK